MDGTGRGGLSVNCLAGALMTSAPHSSVSSTIAAVRRAISASHHGSIEIVIGTTDEGRYAGAATLASILAAPDEARLADVIRADWPAVGLSTSQEHAVEAALSQNVSVLPVLSEQGQPLGCLGSLALLKILGHEHRQDIHRLVGITHSHAEVRHALDDPPVRRVVRRLPWLVVGLILSSAGTFLMSHYEEAMRQQIMLAFFIPSLVYIADAIGTQTEAIAIRWLSLEESAPAGRVFFGEFLTGGILGAALGSIAAVGVALIYGDGRFAAGIGLSIVAAGALASVLGLLLPWLLSGLRIDPAFGSGPVATVVQDLLTIAVYFTIMSAIIP